MKSNKLTIIIIIITVISIVTPIAYDQIKESSEIEVKRTDIVSIINKPSDVDGLEIYYDDELIDNLSKMYLKISNNSNKSILKKDFVSPLLITLLDSSKIVSYTIEEKYPKNLSINISRNTSRQELKLTFDLMNPDDFVLIGVLIDGYPELLEVKARIVGIKNINYTVSDQNRGKGFLYFAIIITSLAFGILVVGFTEMNKSKKSFNIIKNISTNIYNQHEIIENINPYISHINHKKIKNRIKKIYTDNKNGDKEKSKIAFDFLLDYLISDNKDNKNVINFLLVVIFVGLMSVLSYLYL